MDDIGRHFRLESQGRNPALAFAAVLMVFGAVVSFSPRGTDKLITESTGNGPPVLAAPASHDMHGSQMAVELQGPALISVCRDEALLLP